MKRILSAIILFLATITLMAQNSFVVVDKNGNSKFVQDLIFQQDASNDRFSWKADSDTGGYQKGRDIKDLLYIARVNVQLATADHDEVIKMLEDASGANGVSAGVYATTLQSNPNVEEAYSADDDNLVVKLKNGGGRIIYPLYDLQPLFTDGDVTNNARNLSARKSPKKANSYPNGTVAIFSTLKNNESKYAAQIQLVEEIKELFNNHGYQVEPYECKEFTVNAYNKVIKNSSSYRAIIVMSHGALIEKASIAKAAKGVLVSGEECDKFDEADKCWIEDEGKYYKIVSNELNTSANCLIYLGSCYGACWGQDINEDPFPAFNKSAVIGWDGINSISQAHAAILFYRLLCLGSTVQSALGSSFQTDPSYGSNCYSSPYALSYGYMNGNTDVRPNFHDNLSFKLAREEDLAVLKRAGLDKFYSLGRMYGKWPESLTHKVAFWLKPIFSEVRLQLEPMEMHGIKDSDQDAYSFGLIIPFYDVIGEGIYQIEIEPYNTGKLIKPQKPFFFVYSRSFGENCALPPVSKEDTTTPSILGAEGVPVNSISLAAGSAQTFAIDGYSGHTFQAVTLNTSVINVSVSGTTLTVTGVAEGSTYLGVQDDQNKLMAIAEVTVTAGGDTPGPGPGGDVTAYTACPDANHPHWIDLGIGTLWRCCNEGASTPEEDGGYYTFDQAQAYNPPSSDQIEALVNNCSYTWITQNGVKGGMFTGPNGGTIFLPAAGYVWDGKLDYVGTYGRYRSSTPCGEYGAYYLNFNAGYVGTSSVNDRYGGLSVRPVLRNSSPILSVSTNSLSMTEGETSTVDITSGSGEYSVTNLNSDIAKATLGGTTITINAIAAGEAKIVVTDIQTGQKMTIEVTVTAKSSSYTPAGVEAVDLGLPSGTLWANMNLGAEKPEDYGSYFAWGETTGYTTDGHTFDWASYKWCNGSWGTLTKYCNNSEHGTVDNKTVLDAEDDAAHVNWGGSWRVPTLADFQELLDNTTNEWTTQNGVNGRKFTSKTNGNSIFLPAAGYRCDSYLDDVGSFGRYRSSSFVERRPNDAYYLFFSSSSAWGNYGDRCNGLTVRPVTNK